MVASGTWKKSASTCDEVEIRPHSTKRLILATTIALVAAIALSSFIIPIEETDAVADTSGDCGGGLKWEYDGGSKTLKITKSSGTVTGVMNNYTTEASPWKDYRNDIQILEITNAVTYIGNYAFYELTNLKKVTVTDTETSADKDFIGNLDKLTVIGSGAFYECTSLEGCLVIPEKVQVIRDYAFLGCVFKGESGKNHIISDSVENIGFGAFEYIKLGDGNDGAGTLQLSRNLTYIGEWAFYGSVMTIEELVLSPFISVVGANAFCKNSDTELQPIINKLVAMNYDSAAISFEGYTINDKDGNPISDFNSDSFKEHIFERVSSTTDKIVMNYKEDITEKVVSYDTRGGSKQAPVAGYYYKGQMITVQEYEGTKADVVFTGWTYNGTKYQPGATIKMESDNIEFVAVWEKLYKLSYNVNGGSLDPPETKEYIAGTAVTVEGYLGTKTGFGFTGWKYNGSMYNKGDTIVTTNDDMVLVAQWLPRHKVTYDLNGGSGIPPIQFDVLEGAAFTLKNYSGYKTGYQFEGWLYNGAVYEPGESLSMGKKDILIVARWVAVHTVTYDLNGGSGDKPVQGDVAEGDTFTVKGCTATKEDYVFDGWSYDLNTYQEGDIIIMGIEDIVLQAIWKKGVPMHKVTYDLKGGSEPAPIQADVAEGDTFIVKMYTGTKEGYTFSGWQYGFLIYDMGATIKMGEQDITLSAIWLSDKPESQDDGMNAIMIAAIAIGSIAAAGAVVFLLMRRT